MFSFQVILSIYGRNRKSFLYPTHRKFIVGFFAILPPANPHPRPIFRLLSFDPNVDIPYNIPKVEFCTPITVPASAPTPRLTLSFTIGTENLAVSQAGVEAPPKRNNGTTPMPPEK